MLELNRIYNMDCLDGMKDINDNSIDCIIIDPPYIGMINEKWDRKSDKNAKLFFDSVLNESYRILRYGGRFLSFASNDTLQYLYNNKLQHKELLIIDKGFDKVAPGRNTKQLKQHVNHTEFIAVFTKYAREYIKEKLLFSSKGYTAGEINKLLGCATNGGGVWSTYTGDTEGIGQVPPRKQWIKFMEIFKDLPEYDTFEEIFNNKKGMGNILPEFCFRMNDRCHPTQKPIQLLEYLINTYTKEKNTILDPCIGSGTTAIASIRTGRNFIGFEIDKGYFDSAEIRIKKAKEQGKISEWF